MPVRSRMSRVAPAAAAIAVMLSTVGLGGSPSMICSPMLSLSKPRSSASLANSAMAPKSSGMAVPKLRLSGCVMTLPSSRCRCRSGEMSPHHIIYSEYPAAYSEHPAAESPASWG